MTSHSMLTIKNSMRKKVTQNPKDVRLAGLTEKLTAREAAATEVAAATQDKAGLNLKLLVALVVVILLFLLNPKMTDLFTAQIATETIKGTKIG